MRLASPSNFTYPRGHPYSDFVLNLPKHLFQRSLQAARLVFHHTLDSVRVSCESSLLRVRTWLGCTPAMHSKQVKANPDFLIWRWAGSQNRTQRVASKQACTDHGRSPEMRWESRSLGWQGGRSPEQLKTCLVSLVNLKAIWEPGLGGFCTHLCHLPAWRTSDLILELDGA